MIILYSILNIRFFVIYINQNINESDITLGIVILLLRYNYLKRGSG